MQSGARRLVASLLLLAPTGALAQETEELPRVLFLTHSAGFRHSVVTRPEPETLAHAERALIDAAQGRYEVIATQDCGALTKEALEDLDAVFFYTTGELPISEDGRGALMDWIRGGGAFVGSHCASDTYYRFAPYQQMLGGAFDGHPWHEEVGVVVEDREHPATRHLPQRFSIHDEIYQFKQFTRVPLRVLMRLDGERTELSRGKRADGDYALAWARSYGEGRVFYTALGHRESVWEDERFLAHVLGGIDWALEGEHVFREAPADAQVVVGAGEHGLRSRSGEPSGWRFEDGVIRVEPGSGNAFSSREFGDAWVHVEFNCPESPPEVKGQGRGNSGVYVQGRYEVQVLDSHGEPARWNEAGGIYAKHVPLVNAARPAGEWQSYDILFTAPRFDGGGAKTANARMTVWFNGALIHDDVEIDGPTAAAMSGDERATGPLMLQDHGNLVRYRNVWVAPRP